MNRRVFLRLLGFVAAAVLASATAPRAREDGTLRVYVGTYTGGASRGIYLLDFDASSGKWGADPVLAGASENPSFLALQPNGRFLYAVNELKTFRGEPTGAVSAFAIDAATGRLSPLNQQPSEGTDPCYLVVDGSGRNVLVANYTSGTAAVLPLSTDGRLGRASSIRRRTGTGPVRDRQEGPHAHTIVLDRTGRFALWTDLGTDRIVIDRYDSVGGRLEPNEPDGVAITPGSGPRHLAWNPSGRALYVLNELSSTVSALRFDPGRGALEVFQTAAARAPRAGGTNTAAEIVVSPGGRFLYASNRGDDDIAVLAIDATGLGLAPVGHVPAGGRTPRSFAIDPSGRWLIAANQGSSSLVVFRLDAATGLPVASGSHITVPDPVCVLFALSASRTQEVRVP